MSDPNFRYNSLEEYQQAIGTLDNNIELLLQSFTRFDDLKASANQPDAVQKAQNIDTQIEIAKQEKESLEEELSRFLAA